jgi:hypothetical protein
LGAVFFTKEDKRALSEALALLREHVSANVHFQAKNEAIKKLTKENKELRIELVKMVDEVNKAHKRG